MSLEIKIDNDMKEAMKAGNKHKLETLRSVRAAIIEFSKSGLNREMNNEDELKILNNLAKKLALSSPNGLALSPPNGLKSNKIKVKKWLLKNKIKPERRAETLIVREWIKLTKSYPNDTKKT